MNIIRHLFAAFCVVAVGAVSMGAAAHGDEDHSAQSAASPGFIAQPRVEASSDEFELVAQLRTGELSIFINRFATNEPVLGADVEVESGNLKAKAMFRSAQGDYAISEEAFVKAVSKTGAHPLVMTITAGADADLLEGTLKVPEAPHDHADPAADWRLWLAVAVIVAALGAGGWRLVRRRTFNRSAA